MFDFQTPLGIKRCSIPSRRVLGLIPNAQSLPAGIHEQVYPNGMYLKSLQDPCKGYKSTKLYFVLIFSVLSSYYVNGREATLADFISPQVLDSLGLKISEVLEVI